MWMSAARRKAETLSHEEVTMRSFVWAMFTAAAVFAGAAGGAAEEANPVRTHGPADPESSVQHIIVKMRAAGVATASSGRAQAMSVQRPQDRVTALATRSGVRLKQSRQIIGDMHVIHVEPAVSGEPVAATLARLRADPEVEYAELDQRRFPHAVPNDPGYSGQWYMQNGAATPSAVNAQGVWDTTTTGSTGLVIADLDTGIRFEHPDLQWAGSGGRVLPGFDFISDPAIANDGDGWDADPSDPGDWVTTADTNTAKFKGCTVGDSSWHGTRTAGILGALSNNSTGIAGMTWSAWLLPVRVLGKCGGFDSDIVSAMLWAAGVHVAGAPDNPYPAKIENMSLGATGACPQMYKDTIARLTTLGVLVVVSAGNEGGPVDSPANCPGAAGIAGLRQAGTKVGFSSLGPEVALSAPAGNCVNTTAGSPCLYSIDTTFNLGLTGPTTNSYTDQFNTNLGTSFSAPIVSGIAGLMLAANGNLKSAQLISRLREGAKPFPQTSATTTTMCHVPSGSSDVQTSECICTTDGKTCGAGVANALGAVNAALRPIAAVTVTPGTFTPGMTVTLDGSGSRAACSHTVSGYQWASSDSVNHPVTNATGPTTSVTAPVAGSFTVMLTVTDDAGKTDPATVTVTPTAATTTAPATAGPSACLAAISVPSPVAVSVAPGSANVQTGTGTQSFTATVTGTLNTAVTWQVNGVTGGNATVGTISTSGLYSAPTVVPSPATVTVTAVSAADTTKSGTAQAMVTSPVAVAVAPTSANVLMGTGTQAFTATVTNTSNLAVTWQVNGVTGGNATVGTISTAGVYSAPATVPSPATVTIAAVSNADASRSGAAQVTVTSSMSTGSGATGGGKSGGGAIDSLMLILLAGVLLATSKQHWRVQPVLKQ
jgi:serine protease